MKAEIVPAVTPPAVVDDVLPVVAPPWWLVEEEADLPEGVMILRSCVNTKVLVTGDWVRPRVHYSYRTFEQKAWIRELCSDMVSPRYVIIACSLRVISGKR